MESQMVAIVAIALGGACALGGMGLKAFTTWVNRPAVRESDPADLQRIEELEERVAELEERVDFSERLLADRGQGGLTRRSEP